MRFSLHASFALGLSGLLLSVGCAPRAPQEVVVYAALDEEFSRPILEEFTRDTRIEVLVVPDVESTKSVGLTERIIQERARPRCDVFWNNEIVNTLRLEKRGLLAEYDSPRAKAYDEQYRSPRGTWFGFAARARVLIVNTELVKDEERPTSIHDLTDPKWKDRTGIAKPLAGTTATHAACLFATWGDEQAKEFFRAVKQNARIMGGNKQVARAAAEGELAFGLTDTDDATVEIESGMPVAIVFPDQTGDDPLGTLLIPNTLSIIKGAQHREAAEKLVEYLLSPAVEERLAEGPSAQFPLNRNAKLTSRVMPRAPLVRMEVDFQAAAEKWDAAAEFLREEFATAE
jgi:iron(III) transport system substrate-binding protein